MRTNLTEEEKRMYEEMIESIGTEDKLKTLMITVTKDGIQADDMNDFKMPEDMIEYRREFYPQVWVNKEKEMGIPAKIERV